MALNRDKGKTPQAWEDLPERNTIPERGIFINIDGLEGTGKTTLALSAAEMGPIGIIDVDQSVDRAQRPKMSKGRKFQAKVVPIRYKVVSGNTEKNKTLCMPAWKTAKAGSIELAASWATGGIVADTGSELWEVLRFGAFGTLTPKGLTKSLYGPVNGEFRQWIRTIHRHYRRHLIFINQMKQKYKDDKPTDDFERVGFKDLGYLADMTLRTFKEEGIFKVEIVTCKLAPNGPAMEGQIIEPDDDEPVTLVQILTMVTGSEPKDWIK